MGASSQAVSNSDAAFSIDVKSFTVFIYEWGEWFVLLQLITPFEFSLTFSVSAKTTNH